MQGLKMFRDVTDIDDPTSLEFTLDEAKRDYILSVEEVCVLKELQVGEDDVAIFPHCKIKRVR